MHDQKYLERERQAAAAVVMVFADKGMKEVESSKPSQSCPLYDRHFFHSEDTSLLYRNDKIKKKSKITFCYLHVFRLFQWLLLEFLLRSMRLIHPLWNYIRHRFRWRFYWHQLEMANFLLKLIKVFNRFHTWQLSVKDAIPAWIFTSIWVSLGFVDIMTNSYPIETSLKSCENEID